MLLIYSHRITSRVQYTFNLIFTSILGIEYKITSDADAFTEYTGPKLSYTEKSIGDEIFYKCSQLLFETQINTSSFPVLTPGTNSPKDVFALAFFLASRYEEYLPFTPDAYGRFSAKQSYGYKNNLLHKPVVNIAANEIKEMISARYPEFIFPEKNYIYTPTIDIDNAFAYIGKSRMRTLAGYTRALLKADKNDLLKRKNVLSGKEKDPFDTYEFQVEVHSKYKSKPIYFFLLGDWAANDKNLPHTNPEMQELIKQISKNSEIGIHPSFASNADTYKVKIEKERLEKIANASVKKSRQHFLMLKFPNTYRSLIAAGITDDYTMGYADEIGFRAGVCMPFKFYDLEKEEETNLTIHPFAVMDGTLNSYLKLTPEQAFERVKEIIKEIKNIRGEFITIWHNETLSDWREWRGWKDLYEEVIQLAVQA